MPDVTAHQGKEQNERDQVVAWDREDFGNVRDQRQVQDQQDKIADVHRDDNRPEDLWIVDHQTRPRRDVQRDQRAQQDRRGSRPRNAQCEQRHKGTRAGRVVGGLWRGEAFDRPVTELFLLFFGGDVALYRIAKE